MDGDVQMLRHSGPACQTVGSKRAVGQRHAGTVQTLAQAMLDRVLRVLEAADRTQPAKRIESKIGRGILRPRSGLAKIGQAGENDAWIPAFQLLKAESPARQAAGSEGFDYNVCLRNQGPQQHAGARGAKVDDYAVLVPVKVGEQETHRFAGLIGSNGTKATSKIALRSLNLDHVGPEVREKPGAIGSGDAMPQFEYLQPGKRARRRF